MGLRETLEAATPGPWAWNSGGYSDSGHPLMGLQNAENPTSYPVLDCAVLGDPEPADARLIALAPELASLVLDMGEALDRYYSFAPHMAGCGFSANYDEDCDCGRDELDVLHDALLARLDQIGAADETRLGKEQR